MRVKVVRVGDGVSVEFVSHSYPGTYYHRVMRVTGPGLESPLGNQQPDIYDRLELCLRIDSYVSDMRMFARGEPASDQKVGGSDRPRRYRDT